MPPQTPCPQLQSRRIDRRLRRETRFVSPRPSRTSALLLIVIAGGISLAGCTSLIPGRSEEAEKEARLRELMTVPQPPKLVRQAAIPHGMRPVQVDGVALVRGLRGTGGPPDPSAFRDQLVEELKRDDIPSPMHLLERDDTALVRVRTLVPPGAQRRDRLDLRLVSPNNSRASDIHGGFVERTRLRHQQLIQNAVRSSDVMAIGQGSILTRADYDPTSDDALRVEGLVLSGGLVQVDRKLGLVVRPEFEHAWLAKGVAETINLRFFFFDGTTRRGIAKAVEDDFIELDLHPRYRHNVYRLMEVVRAIGLQDEGSSSHKRLTELADQLADPATAADAAIQLEAIGDSAVPTLLQGIESTNPELRYYAAEALAYLDREEAVEPLEEAAREVAAFRHDALLALQELPRPAAIDALVRLMDQPSLETRYGAFCAIRRRQDAGGVLVGRDTGPLKLYRIASTAPAAIVVSLRERPEIVLFGATGNVKIPAVMQVSKGLMLQSDSSQPDIVKVSHFVPGREDRRSTVDSDVGSVVEGIATVGGSYGDVVAMLRSAKDEGYFNDQLAIDPLPRPLRTYHREDDEDDEGDLEDPPEDQSDQADSSDAVR